MNYFRLAIVLWLSIAGILAGAREVLALDISSTAERTIFSGVIKPGDAEQIIKSKAILWRAQIELDSLGGDVDDAIKIAALIKTFQVDTLVPKGAKCASACFFLFLAGQHRLAMGRVQNVVSKSYPMGFVGLHRPYLTPDSFNKTDKLDAIENQQVAMNKVRDYLVAEKVPNKLIDEMMGRPSNDIYWLTAEDLSLLGEYRPAFEEIAIARCKYERTALTRVATLRGNGQNDGANKVLENSRVARRCMEHLYLSVSEHIAFTELLETGWRPWKK